MHIALALILISWFVVLGTGLFAAPSRPTTFSRTVSITPRRGHLR